jgi:hypothetical protein
LFLPPRDWSDLLFLGFLITGRFGLGFGHEFSLLGLAIPASALVVDAAFGVDPDFALACAAAMSGLEVVVADVLVTLASLAPMGLVAGFTEAAGVLVIGFAAGAGVAAGVLAAALESAAAVFLLFFFVVAVESSFAIASFPIVSPAAALSAAAFSLAAFFLAFLVVVVSVVVVSVVAAAWAVANAGANASVNVQQKTAIHKVSLFLE